MPIVMTQDRQYGLRSERINAFRFSTTVEGRSVLHALVGEHSVVVGEFLRRSDAERHARLMVGESPEDVEIDVEHDYTLGVRLDGLQRANDQAAVVINPDMWARYPSIAKVGAIPATISRQELAAQARRVDWAAPDVDAVKRLFVLTMAWGSGMTNGRGPRNTDKALLGGGCTTDALIETRRLVVAGELVAAYHLHRRVAGVGPAFHTKWMWVVGTSTSASPRPLVLDSLVWQSLGSDAIKWDSFVAARGSHDWGERYVAYLHACEAWAEAESIGASDGRFTAEDVEFTLFQMARREVARIKK